MDFFEEVKKLGINVDDAMERFMNNAPLLEKMIRKLPKTIYPSRFGGDKANDLEYLSLIDKGDIENAIIKSHTLKGMMGNISATAFFNAYTKIVSLLREGNTKEARELTVKIQNPLDEFLQCILDLNAKDWIE